MFTTEALSLMVCSDSIFLLFPILTNLQGTKFDASYDRNQPLNFVVGRGDVIKGWDEGLLDMCAGDKRKLTIQPIYGYGMRAVGPIPANSILIFDVELVKNYGHGDSHEEL
jgi:FK506-binding protein 2